MIGWIIAEWCMRNCYFLLDLLIEIRIVWLLLSDLWETTISFLTYWLRYDWFDYYWVTCEKLLCPSWLTDWYLIGMIIAEWLMRNYYFLFEVLVEIWFDVYCSVTYEKLLFSSWLTDRYLIGMIIAEWLMRNYFFLLDLMIET